MSRSVRVFLRRINGNTRFCLNAEGKLPEVITDSAPPYGTGEELTAMELFLMSMCACLSATVIPLLKKMRKTVHGFSLEAEGVKREEYPAIFETVRFNARLVSPDTTEAELHKAMTVAEEKYCPVMGMAKGNVKTELVIEVVAE